MGKIGIAVFVLVTFVCNVKVMSTTECWAEFKIIKNCILLFSLNNCHFFFEIKLQQKRTARRINDGFIIFVSSPFQRSKCGDGFVEFSADNGDCIGDIVAVFVKCSSLKIVL
jgi:hypothetical protein